MNRKIGALTAGAFVAVAGMAAPASATGVMGDVRLGLTHNWTDASFGSTGFGDYSGKWDGHFTSISGGGRVNLPYSETLNIQLDLNATTSLDDSYLSGEATELTDDTSAIVFGGHINYRDQQGLLGVFLGTGRAHNVIGAPVFMAGLEGQYYLTEWTFSGQLGYLDSGRALLLQEAGFIKAGAAYYPMTQVKLEASVAYVDGQNNIDTIPVDVQQWAWSVGAHYWFGKSIPVSGFVEYKGRSEELSLAGAGNADADANALSVGVVFHFGGAGFKDADRNGASVALPDAGLFPLVPTAGFPLTAPPAPPVTTGSPT